MLFNFILKNKIIILAIGAIIVVAGVAFVAGPFKGGTTNLPQLINQVGVGTDICAEFPKEWVASSIGKPIVQTKPFSMKGTYSCNYFINETNFVGINVDDLSVETQKKGQIQWGNTINTDPRIKMEHFIVVKPDGLINSISLVLTPNKFVTVDRFYGKVFNNEEVIAFATKVAERIQKGENHVAGSASDSNSIPTLTPTPQAQVPLPQGTDIVRSFFNLISEGRIPDAIAMMTPSAVPDDSAKQAWGVQFNAFKKITVKNVEPSGENTYKVTLDVQMKPEAANVEPMPYYGWGNGEFVRWISLEKVNNVWKVVGIATGP